MHEAARERSRHALEGMRQCGGPSARHAVTLRGRTSRKLECTMTLLGVHRSLSPMQGEMVRRWGSSACAQSHDAVVRRSLYMATYALRTRA